MNSKPLKSLELLKIFTFFVIQIAVTIFSLKDSGYESFIAICIPTAILLIGYFLMRREKNYKIFNKSIILTMAYTIFIFCSLCAYRILNYKEYLNLDGSINYTYLTSFIPTFIIFIIFYNLAIIFLLKKPFNKHNIWIAERGILKYCSSEPKSDIS